MKTGSRFAHILEKKVRQNLSRLSFNEFKLATNKTLGYGTPRVKLKMMLLLVSGLIPGVETELG